MRRALWIVGSLPWIAGLTVLTGCSLYFGSPGSADVPDASNPPPPPPETCAEWHVCHAGTVYDVPATTANGTCGPDFAHETAVQTCEYGCAFENSYQGSMGDPCNRPPPPVYACTETGTCSANATDGCGAPLQCGLVVSTGSCTCPAGEWSCEPACADGLCSTADVQHAIAGTWTGTVTPPSFASPYTVTLTIAADGSWSALSQPYKAFYYGDNGGAAGEKIFVQAQTSVGAYATVRLFDAEIDGLIYGLHVDAHHLTFSFLDSWLSCTRLFTYDLHR